MNKYILTFFIIFTINLSANEIIYDYLFINSHPIKAKVIIDGIDKGILTPCIVKNISSLNKNILIKKDGFADYVIKVSEIKSKNLEINLMPDTINIYLPDQHKYIIENSTINGPVFLSNIKKGNYKIDKVKNNIIFKKSLNFLPLELALATALGISTTYMFISLGLKEYYYNQATVTTSDFYSKHYKLVSYGFDTSKYIGISITSVLAIALTAVTITDLTLRYHETKNKIQIITDKNINEDKFFYESAIQFLLNGELERSNKVLKTLVNLYPESEYVPLSYYQLGQNYFILKDYKNALLYWEIFIKEYPVAKYYDYVLKNIAEIYYINGDIKTAINYINKILFTEDILEREVIYTFKAKLLTENYLTNQTIENYKLAENEYLSLIENYKNSENLEFYYTELIRLYKKNNDTDKLIKLKKRVESIEDSKTKEIILSYF